MSKDLTIWDAFDNMFENFENSFQHIERTFESIGDKPFQKFYPSYPPTDIYIKQDKSMVFEFAVAGYPHDNINLECVGDHLTLTLKGEKDVDETVHFLKRGIKHADVTAKYAIPSERYDTSKLEAKIDGGILLVTIPAKEKIEPTKIEIKKE